MIDGSKVENILTERKRLHPDNSKIMQKWLELKYDILYEKSI